MPCVKLKVVGVLMNTDASGVFAIRDVQILDILWMGIRDGRKISHFSLNFNVKKEFVALKLRIYKKVGKGKPFAFDGLIFAPKNSVI